MGKCLFAPPNLSAAQEKPILNSGKSFKYKFKLIGNTAAANGILEDTTIAAP